MGLVSDRDGLITPLRPDLIRFDSIEFLFALWIKEDFTVERGGQINHNRHSCESFNYHTMLLTYYNIYGMNMSDSLFVCGDGLHLDADVG